MKTLKDKIKIARNGLIGLSMLGMFGCAGLGAVYMESDDPATRALGTMMYIEGSHEQKMKEAREGRSEVNVNYGNAINDPLSGICSRELGFFQNYKTLWRKCEDSLWRTTAPNGQIFTAKDQNIEEWSRNAGIPVYYGKTKNKEVKDIPFFTYIKIVDINNNGTIEFDEVFGIGKKVFKVNEEIHIFYRAQNNENKVKFSLWTDEGELIDEKTENFNGKDYGKTYNLKFSVFSSINSPSSVQ